MFCFPIWYTRYYTLTRVNSTITLVTNREVSITYQLYYILIYMHLIEDNLILRSSELTHRSCKYSLYYIRCLLKLNLMCTDSKQVFRDSKYSL